MEEEPIDICQSRSGEGGKQNGRGATRAQITLGGRQCKWCAVGEPRACKPHTDNNLANETRSRRRDVCTIVRHRKATECRTAREISRELGLVPGDGGKAFGVLAPERSWGEGRGAQAEGRGKGEWTESEGTQRGGRQNPPPCSWDDEPPQSAMKNPQPLGRLRDFAASGSVE